MNFFTFSLQSQNDFPISAQIILLEADMAMHLTNLLEIKIRITKVLDEEIMQGTFPIAIYPQLL